MKQKLTFLVSIVLMVTATPKMALGYDFSAVSPSGHTLYYSILNMGNSVSVTYPNSDQYNPYVGFEEPTGALLIPDSVHFNGNDYCVTSIGNWSFAFCTDIVSVSIPNTITTIGDCAFGECISLSSISIPDSLISVGVCAFQGCALDTIVLTRTVTSIGNFAFKNCKELVSITIPTSVVNVGFMAFDSCISLTNVIVDTYSLILSVTDTSMGNVHIEVPQTSSWDYSLRIIATPYQGYRYIRWSNYSTSNPDLVYLSGDSAITAVLTYSIKPRICMVDVVDDKNVLYIDRDDNAIHYNIYRESDVSNEYVLLDSIETDSISSWVDSTSRPNTRSYRYRVSGIDQFGYEGVLSPVHKTMHLTISQGVGGRWNLQWTPYEGAEYSTYIIYRGINAEDMDQIDIMPADGNTSYTDEESPSGDVYYQVGIVMSNPCPEAPSAVSAKSTSISRSNIATNSSVGVNSIEHDGINVYSRDGHIIVDGIYDEDVMVYDIFGRIVDDCSQEFPTGVYIVKIGNHPARKVVVVR